MVPNHSRPTGSALASLHRSAVPAPSPSYGIVVSTAPVGSTRVGPVGSSSTKPPFSRGITALTSADVANSPRVPSARSRHSTRWPGTSTQYARPVRSSYSGPSPRAQTRSSNTSIGISCRTPGEGSPRRVTTEGTMIAKLKTVVIDAPDIAALSAFYTELAGFTQVYGDDEWITLDGPDGWRLGLQHAPDHVPPQWP